MSASNYGRHPELRSAVQALRKEMPFAGIIAQSPAMQSEIDKLRRYAHYPSAVLILGETGTGKEVFARALHYSSPRSAHPFVAVNCAALPPDLLENELFGHVSG